ncbi:cytochrome b5 reductase 4 isoform X2 [Lutzomyia longipalpis]|uniref:cytochrome b5 reductase 4 isoform X2 n=1 Tax=Lutzomyia longipalpis TaxID=7200 RepID=UPI002483D50F|nr:cytochrome b5 reductase 4 isoform X2 [Lutzomyia longipalpis]XP_055692249.1 cytochrome b5 reductase 4 isoform X2 [Lutzomyia longipalpis]XP_055692250.1 cytochrome b5 reductase 4 isoform X2 [Lutzomyia longipalpis]
MGDSPKINLTIPSTDRKGSSRSPSPSPTQKRKNIFTNLLPQNLGVIQGGSATGNPRNKCALKPGHSLMDWIRLGSSGCDLAGTKGVVSPVSHAELAKHCKKGDAWIAIRGKVYNVTRYMDFHPGGSDELMRGVGKDATKLFEEVHAWVNYEQLLGKCYIGPLRNVATLNLDGLDFPSGQSNKTQSPTSANNGGFRLPFSISLTPTPTPTAPPTPEKTPDIQPRFDWIQKTSDLTIIFYTKSLCNPGLTVEQLTDVDTEVRVIVERQTFTYHLKFAHEVQWPCVTRIALESGKVELIFRKAQPALWTTYGTMERKRGGGDVEPKEYDAITCHKFNHDSYAIVLRPKRKLLQVQPIGYHISVTVRVQGTGEATRSYTPVPGLYLPVPCPGSCLALLVKSYTSGIVSKSLTSSTSAGSAFRVSQPRGNFALYRLKNHCRIALLAAGSGITPILGIIDYLLERSNNRIELLKLLYFNRTEEDIWCRGKLEAIANKDTRFSVRHILSEPKGTWGGERGRISDEIATDLASRTSPTSAITFCCVCGPPPFNDAAITHLAGAGFTSDDVHVFQG